MSTNENANWTPEAPLLFSIFQTACVLGVSVGTVKNLLNRGELVRRKIGSRTLIPRSSIETFIRHDHVTTKEK
jgi:excisionase family DNA binding protein